MEPSQNDTQKLELTPEDRKSLGLLTPQHEAYISFVASGGIITNEDGVVGQKMTAKQFADKVGVTRESLYRWQKTIPNFWDRVNKRRAEIFNQNRITAIWNGLYLKAAAGNPEQAKIILGHFANWQPPTQKTEVRIGGLGDLVNAARRKKIIDGEPSDGNNA
jgi:hypothetical protein